MFSKFLKSRAGKLSSPMGQAISTASLIGLHMVLAVFIGFGAGLFLDRFFDSAPWLTIILLLAGIAAGFKNMVSQGKVLFTIQEKIDKEHKEHKEHKPSLKK